MYSTISVVRLARTYLSSKLVNQYAHLVFSSIKLFPPEYRRAFVVEETGGPDSLMGDGLHCFEILLFYNCVYCVRDRMSVGFLIKMFHQMQDALFPPLSMSVSGSSSREFALNVVHAFGPPPRRLVNELCQEVMETLRNPVSYMHEVSRGKSLISRCLDPHSDLLSDDVIESFIFHYVRATGVIEEDAVKTFYVLCSLFHSFWHPPGQVVKHSANWSDCLIRSMRICQIIHELGRPQRDLHVVAKVLPPPAKVESLASPPQIARTPRAEPPSPATPKTPSSNFRATDDPYYRHAQQLKSPSPQASPIMSFREHRVDPPTGKRNESDSPRQPEALRQLESLRHIEPIKQSSESPRQSEALRQLESLRHIEAPRQLDSPRRLESEPARESGSPRRPKSPVCWETEATPNVVPILTLPKDRFERPWSSKAERTSSNDYIGQFTNVSEMFNSSPSNVSFMEARQRNIFSGSLIAFSDKFSQPSFDLSNADQVQPGPILAEPTSPYNVPRMTPGKSPKLSPLTSEFFAQPIATSPRSVSKEPAINPVVSPALNVRFFDRPVGSRPTSPSNIRLFDATLKLDPVPPSGRLFDSNLSPSNGRLFESNMSPPNTRPLKVDEIAPNGSPRRTTPGLRPEPKQPFSPSSMDRTRALVFESLSKSGMSVERSHQLTEQIMANKSNVDLLLNPPEPAVGSPKAALVSSIARLEGIVARAEASIRDGEKLREIKSIVSEIRDIANT